MEAVKVADGVPLFSNLDRYFGCDRNPTPTLKAVRILVSSLGGGFQ
jgi:hypothetical protein